MELHGQPAPAKVVAVIVEGVLSSHMVFRFATSGAHKGTINAVRGLRFVAIFHVFLTGALHDRTDIAPRRLIFWRIPLTCRVRCRTLPCFVSLRLQYDSHPG